MEPWEIAILRDALEAAGLERDEADRVAREAYEFLRSKNCDIHEVNQP